jgi:hypothetical protein
VATGRANFSYRMKWMDQAKSDPDKSEGIKIEALPLNWILELKIYSVIHLKRQRGLKADIGIN